MVRAAGRDWDPMVDLSRLVLVDGLGANAAQAVMVGEEPYGVRWLDLAHSGPAGVL